MSQHLAAFNNNEEGGKREARSEMHDETYQPHPIPATNKKTKKTTTTATSKRTPRSAASACRARQDETEHDGFGLSDMVGKKSLVAEYPR